MNSTTAMEQTSYWMWARRKFNPRPLPPPLFIHSPTTTMVAGSTADSSSWEEQAFAEDGLLGGCIWPPRSYSRSFCRREFRSAQALGGHMNVHRRDRARLKQSSSSSSPVDDTTSDPIFYSNSNPNPNPNFHSYSSPINDLLVDYPQRYSVPPVSVRIAGGLELKLGVENWKMGREGKREWGEEEDVGVVINTSNKKRRIDDIDISPSTATSNKKPFSDVIKVNPNPVVEELDLELRLGDPPKVK